jgi:hypothetical protein
MCKHQILGIDEYHAHDERLSNEKSLDKYSCICIYFCGGKMKIRDVIYNI